MDEKEILCRRSSRQNSPNDQRAWSFIASQNTTPNRGVNVLKMGRLHRVEKVHLQMVGYFTMPNKRQSQP